MIFFRKFHTKNTAGLISRIFRYSRWMIYGGFSIAGISIVIALIIFFITVPTIPRLPDDLNDIFGKMTRVYAYEDDGTARLVHTLGGHRRVPLVEISPMFKQAIIATEDADFFNHHGIDKPGIMRAIITNIRGGRILGQGASTITQQLARHLFFTRDKSLIRKIREIMASVQIEARFSKNEILSAYCNNVYFGASAYGIEEAAQRFFSKHAVDLTLGEAALLAGLVQRPSAYNPYYNMDRALNRRDTVFRRMMENGYITKEQVVEARAEKLLLKGKSIGPARGPYYLDYVEGLLLQKYDSNLVYNGGLKVYIAMDLELQETAEQAINNGLAFVDSLVGNPVYNSTTSKEKRQALEGALVAIEPHSGALKALAGGRDYTASEFNRAIENNRQPGSGFKTVVYLTALDHLGYSANTVVVDEPVAYTTELGDLWEPQNFTHGYEGPIILKRAFMRSINVISAKLTSEIGPSTIINYARKLGISSPLEPVLSLALGSNGVSPLEMASAYSVFATGGVYHQPYAISRIEDSEGRVIENIEPEPRRAIDAKSAYLMLDFLRGVVLGGTGASIRYRYGFTTPSGGKTGTSNESKDVWFNGFTKDLSASVWVGYDDARPILSTDENTTITGASGAIPVWVRFMKQATEILNQRKLIPKIATKDTTEVLLVNMLADSTNVDDLEEILIETPKETEKTKDPPAFPMPLGLERVRVDIRTGELSDDPESSLHIIMRGTTPKIKDSVISSSEKIIEDDQVNSKKIEYE